MPELRRERRERQWAEEVRQGSEAAFKEMFYAYRARLCAFAAGYVGSYDLAREVVQDVFLKIWERRAAWHLRGTLKAYLYQAVRNQALNYAWHERVQRAKHDALQQSTAALPRRRTAVDAVHLKELAAAVEEAVTQLPERRRMVFLLHRRHGCTYAEIARIMGITPKTVENQMGRALAFLRSTLAPDFFEPR